MGIVGIILGGGVMLIIGSNLLGLLDTHHDEDEDESQTLVELARALRSRTATQPEDKAFATYGILRRLDIQVPDADYHLPLGAIYQNLQERILTHYPASINLLADAGISSLVAPSWVPDRSTVEQRSWLIQDLIYDPLKRSRLGEIYKHRHRITQGELRVHGTWRGNTEFSPGAFPAFDVQECCSNSSDMIAALQHPAIALFE